MLNSLESRSARSATWLVILAAIVLTGGAWLVGCGSSTPIEPTENATLTIELTDAPTDELSEVIVCIVGLAVKHAEHPVQSVSENLGEFDLLELQGTTRVLVTSRVPSGTYEYVQVDLDPSCSSVVEIETGQRKGLAIPNPQVRVVENLTLPEGRSTRVVLDFDADQSLVKQSDGEWLLEPVIVVQQISQA
jgi:hypothetical protein